MPKVILYLEYHSYGELPVNYRSIAKFMVDPKKEVSMETVETPLNYGMDTPFRQGHVPQWMVGYTTTPTQKITIGSKKKKAI